VANNDFYVCGLLREPFTVGVNVFDPTNKACSAAPGTPYVGSNGNPNYPGTSDCKYIPMYPTVCTGGVKDYKSCTYDPVKNPEAVGPGAISCDKKSNSCPAFYTEGATQSIDETSGWCVPRERKSAQRPTPTTLVLLLHSLRVRSLDGGLAERASEGGALLRRKRAGEEVVGGRPPEPPPRPARLHPRSVARLHPR
jgi:hypothetical protein